MTDEAMTTPTQPPLAGMTILIAEDEFLIALEAQRIVEEAGGATILASTLMQARIHLASTTRIDATLLDLRLGHEDALPLARELHSRNTPVVIASGFDPGVGLPGVPVVAKVYRDADLVAALAAVCRRFP
jgi:DNA-binding NarL/FixJ family response regulator